MVKDQEIHMADKYITRKELSFQLSCSPRTIYNWEKQGLPVYKFADRHPRYIFEEVEQWLIEMANQDVS